MIVPDLLRCGLEIVFCGTAPSYTSAQERAYYAYKHNRFWLTLFEIGLTPRQFLPHEYPLLLELGIGLTDLCKSASGNDDELPVGALDPNVLHRKVLECQPHLLAFTSKTAGEKFLGRKVEYGRQLETIGATSIVVLPSTSPRARHYWSIVPWQQLSDQVRNVLD